MNPMMIIKGVQIGLQVLKVVRSLRNRSVPRQSGLVIGQDGQPRTTRRIKQPQTAVLRTRNQIVL